MLYLKNAIKHFIIITKHKIEVGRACFDAGLYWQAITHDLSKYFPIEFIEYAQYYNGKISPVDKAREVKGYCNAWQHHKGHNLHHYEYWIDRLDDGGVPLVIPYKYAMEMICDYIGAGKVYERGKWNQSMPLNYWLNKKKTAKIHYKSKLFFDEVLKNYSVCGKLALNKTETKKIYSDICKNEL